MAKLNRNWINDDRISHHVKNANGLNRKNTQEFHDALIGVTNDLLGGIQGSQLLMSIYQQQLEQLWDKQSKPKWLRQPLHKFRDNQIKVVIEQSNKNGVSLQETVMNLLLRDKKWALLAEFHDYQKLLPSNPIKAVDQRPRLMALIDENNDQNDLVIDKAYQSLIGFERLRQISKSTFKRIQNLSGSSNQSKRIVNVDFDEEATVLKNTMSESSNTTKTKDNGLEK